MRSTSRGAIACSCEADLCCWHICLQGEVLPGKKKAKAKRHTLFCTSISSSVTRRSVVDVIAEEVVDITIDVADYLQEGEHVELVGVENSCVNVILNTMNYEGMIGKKNGFFGSWVHPVW
jgi:hypothetical protein